jgi:hypothetical protein
MTCADLITPLISLAKALKRCKTFEDKLKVLAPYQKNQDFLHSPLSVEAQVIVASLYAIGEGSRIFKNFSALENPKLALDGLLSQLMPVEQCYASLGGIVGYHLVFLQMLSPKETPYLTYAKPPGLSIDSSSPEVRQAIRAGISSLPLLAEIYPVAGAADRLDLHHALSQEALPAAELRFLGITLLEKMIVDLQAREYLFYKLHHKRITTPIVLMTSKEKSNDEHIFSILQNNHYFGRPPSQYFFILQPLVPVISVEGHWALQSPLHLIMKPGGHGVLWKIGRDQGAFRWLKQLKRTKAIIRQINNPLAGVDHTLVALCGVGCTNGKSFGFVSCERLVASAEGMNVLIKRKIRSHYEYSISNIEYTDFKKQGIKDKPSPKTSPYSLFPANTNILFADLTAVEKIAQKHPFPGMLINLKSPFLCLTEAGHEKLMPAGRLECTMQNIADYIITKNPSPLLKHELTHLKTFVLYNKRGKTMAVTKKLHKQNLPFQDTPEDALLKILNLNNDLLRQCGFITPPIQTESQFLESGPNLLFTYHPALGPLFSIIKQKLRKGKIDKNSELKLDIADMHMENLQLKGSLIIQAEHTMGHKTKNGLLRCSDQTGKCTLINVKITNKGMKKNVLSNYWKYTLEREEALTLFIEGNGEFEAKNITFKGHQSITVPSGYKMTAFEENGNVKFHMKKISKSSPMWSYHFKEDNSIILSLIKVS